VSGCSNAVNEAVTPAKLSETSCCEQDLVEGTGGRAPLSNFWLVNEKKAAHPVRGEMFTARKPTSYSVVCRSGTQAARYHPRFGPLLQTARAFSGSSKPINISLLTE